MKKYPYWVDWACRWCLAKTVYITDEGETFDGGDEWYCYHCTSCNKHWKHYTEYN